jgi:hypothetical protein
MVILAICSIAFAELDRGGEFRFGTASIYMARHQQEVSSEWG